MLRARLFWRWCRVHPRISGIGGALLALFVVVGALGDSGNQKDPAAAASSLATRSAPPIESASSLSSLPAPSVTATSASPSASPTVISAAPVDLTQRGQSTAIGVLATISIKGRASKSGYDRDQFGTAWTDDTNSPLGHNGCDTRNDVLRRDLGAVALKPNSNGCAVSTGVLRDPYTATTIRFTRGASTSNAVQIDHVVSLSDAWQTGASRWTDETRADLANDPLNLLAVSGPTNQSKGDGDAASWLPPNKSYRCAYVARQVAVKARYGLWATSAEYEAISRVLAGCPSQPAPDESGQAIVHLVPTRTATPTKRRTTAPPATDPVETTPDDVYYANCTAVRAAGAAPLYRGQPGYDSHLDRDGDGVACE